MPFIFQHVAAMPDVHVGIGATVGSVLPTKGAVIPAAAGVDMLRELMTDPQGQPMISTYGSSKTRRYAYYETCKDLARPGDVPGIRFQRGQFERHLIVQHTELLEAALPVDWADQEKLLGFAA